MPEPISFPNLYAIRGTKPRWALDWIRSLDRVLELKPEVVLNGHGDPIWGSQEITQRLTRYRDAIQYVHDETVKGMNSGKDVFTLMQEIKLPAKFNLSEAFGKVNWSVRGIYEGYAGWFDGNPTTMYNLPPSSALYLTEVVLAYDPQNNGALKARIKALEQLEKSCENFVEEGWLQYGMAKAKEKLHAPD